MSTTAAFPQTMQNRDFRRTLAIFSKEAKYDFLGRLRLPVYSLSTVLFPVMFYILFGLVLNRGQRNAGLSVATYLMTSYATFGVMGASLFGFGVGIAMDRGLGWLQLKRASPMPPLAYFAAKVFTSMTFSTIIVLLLMTLGVAFGGVRLTSEETIQLLATLVVGGICFCAMGLAIGSFTGPNAAPAVVNLLYLPISFASGLWIPINMLPKVLQKVAPALPPYHLGQLALSIVGAGRGAALNHWGALVGFTLIFLGIARIGFQQDEQAGG